MRHTLLALLSIVACCLVSARPGLGAAVVVSQAGSGDILVLDEEGHTIDVVSGLERPFTVKFDRHGNLFVIERPDYESSRVSRIDSTGQRSTFTDALPNSVPDGSGGLLTVSYLDLAISDDDRVFTLVRIHNSDGAPSLTEVWELAEGVPPSVIASFAAVTYRFTFGPGGDLYIAANGHDYATSPNEYNDPNNHVLRMSLTGEVSSFYEFPFPNLSQDPPECSEGVADCRFNLVSVRFDSNGAMFLLAHSNVEGPNYRYVWKYQGGSLALFAVLGNNPGTGSEGALTMTIDGEDNLFFVGGGAQCAGGQCTDGFVQKVNPMGQVTTLALFANTSLNAMFSIDDEDFDSFPPPNQAPSVSAGGPYSTLEGSALSLDGATASDPDGDALTLSWSVNSSTCSFSDPWVLTPDLVCTDDGSFVVTLTAADGVNSPVSADATVTVNNVAPSVLEVTVPLAPNPIESSISVSATFSDPAGASDEPFTCDVDYGDGSGAEPGSVTGSTCTGPDHVYSNPGVYTPTVTVADKDGDAGFLQATQLIVIYDADGGFVTGGGWIDSAAGAYTPDLSLAGRASFGFVSRYKKGATTPTGQTEFHFRVAGLDFHSDTYEWLVVAGPKAMYKGTGAINGRGDWGFLLSGIDEALTPSTDVDLFRIKIWNKNDDDAVIYDTNLGAADDAEPTTAIGGGNITVHKAE